MNRTIIYWLFHTGGWFLFCLLLFLAAPLTGDRYESSYIASIMGFVSLVVSVHAYKQWFLRRWALQSIRTILVKLLIGSLLCAAAAFLLIIAQSLLLYVIVKLVNYNNPTLTIGATAKENAGGWMLIGSLNYIFAILVWSFLYVAFRYYDRVQNLHLQQSQADALMKEMQLQQLMRQLNPHFLFNSINSIKALVLDDDKEKPREALTRLGDLLRYSLNAGKNRLIPLRNELAITADYLYLEQTRFESRLQYDIQCSEAAAAVLIPPVIVQTLAENSIKHGIEKNETGGRVAINASITGQWLYITIQNTGSADLEKLYSGIGTANTRQRLQLLYNGQASFSVANHNNTVIATIKIPVNHETDHSHIG